MKRIHKASSDIPPSAAVSADETVAKPSYRIKNIVQTLADAFVNTSRTTRRIAAGAAKLAEECTGTDARKSATAWLTRAVGRAQSLAPEKTAELQGWINALLTTEFAASLASWTADTFNKNSNKYDAAIDAAFNAGNAGSSATHHLIDGNHSILGAIHAALAVHGDDSSFTAIAKAMEHLARDLASRTGIQPFFTLSKEQLVEVKELAGSLGISKSYVNDFLQFNVPEVLGAFFAVVPVCLGWSKLESARFAEMAGSAGTAALISVNPILGLVAMVSLARSFTLNLRKGTPETNAIAKKASLGSLQVIIVNSVAVAIGGPAWVGIISGMVVANAARRYADNPMTKAEIVQYITKIYAEKVFPAACESREAALEFQRGLQESVWQAPRPHQSRLV